MAVISEWEHFGAKSNCKNLEQLIFFSDCFRTHLALGGQ